MPRLPLDPRHGTHDPTTATPARAPGSVRRTTSVDMLRPSGIDGDLVLVGIGRDLHTAPDGTPTVLDAGSFEAVVDYADAQRVREIRSTPAILGIDRLMGRSASTGFRAALNEVVEGQDMVGRPVYQLLDDLPVAVLISGFSPQRQMAAEGTWPDAAASTLQRRKPEGLDLIQQADLCAGWHADGTIIQGLAEGFPRWSPGPTRRRWRRTTPGRGTTSPASSRRTRCAVGGGSTSSPPPTAGRSSSMPCSATATSTTRERKPSCTSTRCTSASSHRTSA